MEPLLSFIFLLESDTFSFLKTLLLQLNSEILLGNVASVLVWLAYLGHAGLPTSLISSPPLPGAQITFYLNTLLHTYTLQTEEQCYK